MGLSDNGCYPAIGVIRQRELSGNGSYPAMRVIRQS
jgi:hypothetical protein